MTKPINKVKAGVEAVSVQCGETAREALNQIPEALSAMEKKVKTKGYENIVAETPVADNNKVAELRGKTPTVEAPEKDSTIKLTRGGSRG